MSCALLSKSTIKAVCCLSIALENPTKMCYVHVPPPHNESNHVLQQRTNTFLKVSIFSLSFTYPKN